MSLHPECIPCIMNQALHSAKVSHINNETIQFEILKQVYNEILKVTDDVTAPQFSSTIQHIVRSYSGIEDPYLSLKNQNLERALLHLPYLRSYIENSNDRLEAAVRVAILGNIIDLGANPNFDLQNEVQMINSNTISLEDYRAFKDDVDRAASILYIGDNTEEAVFDKLLIEQLAPKKIIFVVREIPVLNDITLSFAKRLKIDSLTEIISSGSTIPGTDMRNVSDHFKKIFYDAPLVIAKGQGNYETLFNEKRPIYFMFKVKCTVISKMCGRPIGTSVLYNNQHSYCCDAH